MHSPEELNTLPNNRFGRTARILAKQGDPMRAIELAQSVEQAYKDRQNQPPHSSIKK